MVASSFEPTCGDPATVAIEHILQRFRDRWPHARARRCSTGVRWTDGPASIDVRAALLHDPSDPTEVMVLLDNGLHRVEGGPYHDRIALERTWSVRTVAFVALAARERSEDALQLLDELRLHEIPSDGRPPLADPDRLAHHWDASASLARLARTTTPVRVTATAAIRLRLLALDRIALAAGDGLDRDVHPSPRRMQAHEPAMESGYPEELRLTPWPDVPFTGVLSPPNLPPSITLRWNEGPSPGQVREHLLDHGLPDPFAGDVEVVLDRQLSATTVAASMLLYQLEGGRPYRDETIHWHWMARWKSATMRQADQRDQPCREHLLRIQEFLLDEPLPLTGPVEVPKVGTRAGEWLWAGAEVLIGLLSDPPSSRTYRPGHAPARRLAAQLATVASQVGIDVLDLALIESRHVSDHEPRVDSSGHRAASVKQV